MGAWGSELPAPVVTGAADVTEEAGTVAAVAAETVCGTVFEEVPSVAPEGETADVGAVDEESTFDPRDPWAAVSVRSETRILRANAATKRTRRAAARRRVVMGGGPGHTVPGFQSPSQRQFQGNHPE